MPVVHALVFHRQAPHHVAVPSHVPPRQALALFAGVLATAFILVGWGFNAIVAAGLAV